MRPCQNCQATIDEYFLDKQLESLRELTVDDFNLCSDCIEIVADACVACHGAVYVPRSVSGTPDYCPACRAEQIDQTGQDPGWYAESIST